MFTYFSVIPLSLLNYSICFDYSPIRLYTAMGQYIDYLILWFASLGSIMKSRSWGFKSHRWGS